MVVLDTDHLSILEWGRAPSDNLRQRLGQLSDQEVFATIVSFEDQTRGWLSYMARAKNLHSQVEAYRRLKRHLDTYRSIPVLDFDELAAVEFSRLRRLKLRIGTFDLKIASIAVSNGATLLTRNKADFERIPGLTIENWIS
jgi:tRNA(fMet)-specific endonuclease VapC